VRAPMRIACACMLLLTSAPRSGPCTPKQDRGCTARLGNVCDPEAERECQARGANWAWDDQDCTCIEVPPSALVNSIDRH